MTIGRQVLHCILVEDSDEDADTLCEALRQSGIAATFQRVTTGGACLALLRKTGRRLPALVLMDLNTPGIDGREALSLIKSDPCLKSIPVIITSTSVNSRDLAACYGAGANAYHVKPVCYPDHVLSLIAVLQYWLVRAVLPNPESPVS